MPQLLKTGRLMFAPGIAALGVLCFIDRDFIAGRPPAWPASWHLNPALGYVSGAVLIVCGIAVLVQKQIIAAAYTIASLILVLSVLRHLPTFAGTWLNAFKAIALAGGSLLIAASCKPTASKLVITGTLAVSIFFIACGYAHFKYAPFVDTLIPDFIPFHSFWTYFCGICLLAAGIGLLLPQTRWLAALMSGIMITGWFLLLHIPRFLANPNDTSDRLGVFESFTIAGICFCLAGIIAKEHITENKFAAITDADAYLSEIQGEI